jgi:hypothetical protein
MNLKECVLDNQECKNIIAKAVEVTNYIEIKKDGKWLLDKDKLLNKKVKTSTRIGNDKIIIEYYMYR